MLLLSATLKHSSSVCEKLQLQQCDVHLDSQRLLCSPSQGRAHLDMTYKASIRFQTEATIESFVFYKVHFKITASWGKFFKLNFLKFNILWNIVRLLNKKTCVINLLKSVMHKNKMQHFPQLAHLKTQNQLSRNAECCLKKTPSRQFYPEYSNLIMYSYNRGEIQHEVYSIGQNSTRS